MTSTFFQRILLLVLLAGCMTGLHAQEYKYEIGGMAGGAFYMGDVNKNAFFKGLNPAFGAVFRYNPNFRWALKTNLMWGQVSGTTEGQQNVFPDHAQGSFSRSLIELGGQMEFNFFPYSPLGVGLKYKVKNRINLGCEFSFRKLFGDGLDVTDDSNAFLDDPYHMKGSFLKNKDWYSFLLFTVTWDFGPRCRTCNNAKNIDNIQ